MSQSATHHSADPDADLEQTQSRASGHMRDVMGIIRVPLHRFPGPIYTAFSTTRREIRVLELAPGTGDDPVRGDLLIKYLPTTTLIMLKHYIPRFQSAQSDDFFKKEMWSLLNNMMQAIDDFGRLRGTNPRSTTSAKEQEYEQQHFDALCDIARDYEQILEHGLATYRTDPEMLRFAGMIEALREVQASGRPLTARTGFSARYETNRDYEAISYCWGMSPMTEQISLNGGTVEMPRSAVEALRRFRLADKPRLVWMDAVCINQKNLEERSQQVLLMGDIYRYAKRTLVWLGDYDEIISQSMIHIWESSWRLRLPYESGGARLFVIGRGMSCKTRHTFSMDGSPNKSDVLLLLHPLEKMDCAPLERGVCLQILSVLSANPYGEARSETSFSSEHVEYITSSLEILRDAVHQKPVNPTNTHMRMVEESWRWSAFVHHLNDILFEQNLFRIVQRPWFSRLWTYPEAKNSSKLLYFIGTDRLESNSMDEMISWCLERMHRPDLLSPPGPRLLEEAHAIASLSMRLTEIKEISPPMPLFQLARATRFLDCSDPRDKIYALLSLTRWVRNGWAMPAALRVDYAESVIDCMCRATKAMIDETNLGLIWHATSVHIGYCEGPSNHIQVWPSWCPKWDITWKFLKHKSREWEISTEPSACDYDRVDKDLLSASVHVRSLLLQGFILDRVFHCWSDRDLKRLLLFIKMANPKLKAKILNVLLLNHVTEEELLGMISEANGDFDIIQFLKERKLLRLLEQYGRDRSLIKLHNGTLALAPEIVETGDIVVILFGGHTPYLLRPCGYYYLYIGFCYIPEITLGDMVEEWAKKNIPPTGFLLR